ncbi:MAG: hypothetical protein AB1592_16775 [Pseudomonadota bacterium]
MNQILSSFRLAAILIGGGIAAILLFTLLGSVLVAVGIFAIIAAVAGGLQFLVFGRARARAYEDIQRSPGGYDMIDVTPPDARRRPR